MWAQTANQTKARQVKSSRPYKTSALSRAATISGDLISSPYPVCKSLRGRRKPRSACNATFWIFARMNFLCPSLKKDYSEKRGTSIIHHHFGRGHGMQMVKCNTESSSGRGALIESYHGRTSLETFNYSGIEKIQRACVQFAYLSLWEDLSNLHVE